MKLRLIPVSGAAARSAARPLSGLSSLIGASPRADSIGDRLTLRGRHTGSGRDRQTETTKEHCDENNDSSGPRGGPGVRPVRSVFAQETTGTLTGHVVDAQGAGGPRRERHDHCGQGVKAVTCDEQGRFSMPFLTPGPYTAADAKGFAPRAEERRRLDRQADRSLPETRRRLRDEAVNVTAGGDVISATSTTTGATLTSELLRLVPSAEPSGEPCISRRA